MTLDLAAFIISLVVLVIVVSDRINLNRKLKYKSFSRATDNEGNEIVIVSERQIVKRSSLKDRIRLFFYLCVPPFFIEEINELRKKLTEE